MHILIQSTVLCNPTAGVSIELSAHLSLCRRKTDFSFVFYLIKYFLDLFVSTDLTSNDGRVAAQKINLFKFSPLNLLTKQFHAYSTLKNK